MSEKHQWQRGNWNFYYEPGNLRIEFKVNLDGELFSLASDDVKISCEPQHKKFFDADQLRSDLTKSKITKLEVSGLDLIELREAREKNQKINQEFDKFGDLSDRRDIHVYWRKKARASRKIVPIEAAVEEDLKKVSSACRQIVDAHRSISANLHKISNIQEKVGNAKNKINSFSQDEVVISL